MDAARERRSSSTSALTPFATRKELTDASAACGGWTGRFSYSEDTKVKEHPPKGFHKHGSRSSAAAGVASGISTAITALREHQSRLLKVQYAAITAMKNDMRSARPAMAAI